MTAEQLHDAIGLLPSDLIAEADKKRCAKPKVLHWKRFAAMAACFALVLSCSLFAMQLFSPRGATGSAAPEPAAAAPMEAAAEAPAAEAAAPEEGPGEMTGNGGPAEDSASALPTMGEATESCLDIDGIGSRAETPLKPSTACFSSSATVTLIRSRSELDSYLTEKEWIYDFSGLVTATEGYDKAWFAEHDLLLAAVRNIPANSDPYITALNQSADVWELCIACDLTMAEDDPGSTAWHFLLEVEKDQIPDAGAVTVIFE